MPNTKQTLFPIQNHSTFHIYNIWSLIFHQVRYKERHFSIIINARVFSGHALYMHRYLFFTNTLAQNIFLLFIRLDLFIFVTTADKIFPVSLRNRLISGGLEPVLSPTEKLCLASFYIQFSTTIKCTIIRFKTRCFSQCLLQLGAKKELVVILLFILYPRKAIYNMMREITINNNNA